MDLCGQWFWKTSKKEKVFFILASAKITLLDRKISSYHRGKNIEIRTIWKDVIDPKKKAHMYEASCFQWHSYSGQTFRD